VNMPFPDICAVVVYFRTRNTLATCLAALRDQSVAPKEIVVVDNSSAEDGQTIPPVAEGDWLWLRSEENLGYGAACNAGVAATSSPLVLFLNADVTLRPGALAALRRRLLANRQTAVVGPRIWDAKGEVELSARDFPSMRTGLLGRSSLMTKMLVRLGRPPAGVAAALDGPRRVDWVSGACQLVRRSEFRAVGGFDEEYWMYWEDADLCWRIAEQGGHVWFEPAAQADHQTGASGQSQRTIRAFHESASRFYERHLARSWLDASMVRAGLLVRAHTRARRLPS